MFSLRANPLRSRGVSLVELLVVLAIAAVLTGLTLVAVQRSRGAARRAQCQNNRHQLRLAMDRFFELRKRMPHAAPAGQLGGWPIDLLPFVEESALADGLLAQPTLEPGQFSPLIRQRPALYACPLGNESDSRLDEVPPAHYVLWTDRTRPRSPSRQSPFVKIGHAAPDCLIPWPAGPEYDLTDRALFEAYYDYDPHVPQ